MSLKVWIAERLYFADLNANFAAVIALSGCRVTRTAVQSIANATDTAIAFDSEIRDDGAMHSNVTNNTRLTAPVTGWYDYGGCVEIAANATGVRQMMVKHSGTGAYIDRLLTTGTSSTAQALSLSGAYYLTAGEYLELYVNQNSGGALNVNLTGNYSPIFWMAARRGN